MTGYGYLRRVDDGNAWEMGDTPPHVAIRLKHLFARVPKHAVPPYRFPNDPTHAADLEWFLIRYPMTMSDRDREALAAGRMALVAGQAEMGRIFLPDYRPPARAGLREGCALRRYQAQAVDLLGQRRALLLADEVGLGKTFAACGAMLLPGALPSVVVVEPHVQRQWINVIQTFTGLWAHGITTTKAHTLPRADVYVFRYSNILGWTNVFLEMEVGLACWDEIQALRKGTATAKGASSSVLAQRAAYRLGLTATPIYNYGAEIFDVMGFLDGNVLGGRFDFSREWMADLRRIKNPEALGSYLRDQHVFLRRTRTEVGRELPPVNRIVDYVGFDAAVVRSAEDLARQLALRASSGAFVDRGQAARELDMLVRHATGLAKAPMVADYVRILLESGEPVLLVGWHRDVYDVWLEKLADFAPALYTGSETAAMKECSKERFLKGETDLMIMSLRSGAGLDGLQERCRTVVFGELDWSPGIHHQVIGRLDRDRAGGVREQVMAIFLVTDEGSDPPMMEVLGLKASEAAAIVDPGLGIRAATSDETHLQKLVKRYLAGRGATPAAGAQRNPSGEANGVRRGGPPSGAAMELDFGGGGA